MNDWKKPSFVEICMNAEIGAYQEDRDDPRDAPPFVGGSEGQPATPADAALGQSARHE